MNGFHWFCLKDWQQCTEQRVEAQCSLTQRFVKIRQGAEERGRFPMSLVIAMLVFAFVMSITPGPANMMIVSSGVSHGFRRTMPFVTGATLGFTALLVTVGLGFFQLLVLYPSLLNYLTIAGSGYVTYMGYKIMRSSCHIKLKPQPCPRFYQGFLITWLNPKAWSASLSGVSLFSGSPEHNRLTLFFMVYFFVCYACFTLWAYVGDRVRALLTSESSIRAFNIIMGGTLILCAVYLVYSHFGAGSSG